MPRRRAERIRISRLMANTSSLKAYRMPALLGATALLAWLNWSAPATPTVVGANERRKGAELAVTGNAGTRIDTQAHPSELPVLPEVLSRIPLDPQGRDPFVPELPKPPPAPKPAPVPVAPPPPPPQPPPLSLVYIGRFLAPDGSLVVYALSGDTPLELTPGLSLPNGYRVDGVKERFVELSFPAMNQTMRWDLPAPQKYETR